MTGPALGHQPAVAVQRPRGTQQNEKFGPFFLPLLFIDWRLHRQRPLMFYFHVWALLHGW